MNKYKLSMKTPSGLGTEYIYVESKYDNFERYLKEHNLKYQKQGFKTKQDKEIERLNNIINELEKLELYEFTPDYDYDENLVEGYTPFNIRKYIQELKGSDKE